MNREGLADDEVREIIEDDNNGTRILYGTTNFPKPLLPRSITLREVVLELDLSEGRKGCLIVATQTTHDSRPEEPKKDIRLKQYMFATFIEEIETGENPIARSTTLGCSTPQLPFFVGPIARMESEKFCTYMIEIFAAKFEHDNSEEIALIEIEDENEERLNMGNTLKKVFSGSKFYIFVISIIMMSQVMYGKALSAIDFGFTQHWESSGLCNATNSTVVVSP